MSLDNAGKYLAVANFTGGTISLLSVIEDGGGLSEVIGSPFTGAVNPMSVAISPDGKHVYASDDASDEIYGHEVDPGTGALTATSGTPFATGNSPFGLKVSPDSGFVYATSTGGSLLYGYGIGAGGTLTGLSTPSITTGASPHGLDIGGKSGKYVYTADTGANAVSGFTRSKSTGELTRMTGSPFAAGLQPWDLVIVNVLK
jgi:6-phosphogluconolactonase (cycloisomerase 2 family)